MIDVLDEHQLKVFKFLWDNPFEEHSILEISKNSKVSYGATWKILKEFKKKEIVTLLVKKAHLYNLNFESELCFKAWELFNSLRKQELSRTKGHEKFFNAMNYLNKNISPEFIVLFGSVARKQATEESDLDVLVLTKKKLDTSKIAREMLVAFFVEPKITVVNEKELLKYIREKRLVYQKIWVDGIVWSGSKKYFELMKKLW